MTLRQRLIFRAMKRSKKSKTVSGTDIINGLSDDLLLKILLYLPTKVAISTCVLSKRWQFLWMWLPKLKYGSEFDSESECKRLQSFLDTTLPLHRAPVIRSFHLNLASNSYKPEDIRDWVAFAISHHLRKLKITTCIYFNKPDILSSSFYNCKSLVSLELHGHIRLDVPRMDCLPSLTTLNLTIGKHLDGESLQRLLSICPVLENLFVDCESFDGTHCGMGLVTINIPSLEILHFCVPRSKDGLLDGLVIDTPSLEFLEIEYYVRKGHSCLFKSNMPNLEQAYLDFQSHDDISSLIQFVTSVKHLTICLRDIVYGGGFVFSQLEHLKLCVCSDKSSSNLLMQLLEASPNLRVLDIFEMDNHKTSIGEHIQSSLQAYDWSRYLKRRPEKKDLKVYILGERWSIA